MTGLASFRLDDQSGGLTRNETTRFVMCHAITINLSNSYRVFYCHVVGAEQVNGSRRSIHVATTAGRLIGFHVYLRRWLLHLDGPSPTRQLPLFYLFNSIHIIFFVNSIHIINPPIKTFQNPEIFVKRFPWPKLLNVLSMRLIVILFD